MSCLEPDLKRKKMNTTESIQESSAVTDLPSAQELEEMCMSPDPFAESSPEINLSSKEEDRTKLSQSLESCELQEVQSTNTNRSSLRSEQGGGESSTANEEVEDPVSWKGCALEELQKGRNGFGMPQLHPIKPSSNHTVMFQIGHAKTEHNTTSDAWDNNHVRMPCSPQNKYPVGENVISRWDMVKTTLEKPVKNSQELEAAIMSYNKKYLGRWDFSGLHYFFNEALEEEEMKCFFSDLLPQIIELALQLPALITRPLPLLRKGQTHSISLTQQQVACLLANALFCTFPRRNAARKASEYATFPDINFNRLFHAQKKKSFMQRASEKLKCIFHYFRRVCCDPPKGNITFTRRHIPLTNCPAWDSSGHFFRKLHITSRGTIEDCGRGMLQMDFANKMVGGGVLGWGCVQEEIRFVICPELIIARLFTECLDATEALVITGCEQYSTYLGYADNFTWCGDYQDKTPRDSSSRMLCSVVAIDALYLRYPTQQFIVTKLLREINKAYVGFFNQDVNPEHISAVATGNWGCGVYRGNTRLKALLQLMAASQTGRALAYFTFGDDQLRDDVAAMHKFLVDHRTTVGAVWRHMCKYYDQCYRSGIFNQELYDYLYKCIDPSFSKKGGSVKGRHTAVLSPSKMKTTSFQNEKSKQSESFYSKGNQDVFMKVSPVTSPAKSSASVDQTQSATGSDDIVNSVDDAHATTALMDESIVSKGSKNPFTTKSSTAIDKVKSQQHSLKKMWRKSPKSSQVQDLHCIDPKNRSFHSSISSIRSVSPTKNENSARNTRSTESVSPTRSISPTGPSPAKCENPSKSTILPKSASLEFATSGDECNSNDANVSWSEQYTKSRHLTIQKRISDYFYEINVPK